jgi:hypothetical protein
MISLVSKITAESKTMPGVTFTVRVLNKIQRARRDLPVMAARQKISLLIREYGPLQEIPDGERTPEQEARMAAIDAEYSRLQDGEIKPCEIRAGLVSLAGIEIDGKPATADSLIEASGADYDELLDEIATACRSAASLSPAETKNLQSDSTSTEPVGTDSTASGVRSVS